MFFALLNSFNQSTEPEFFPQIKVLVMELLSSYFTNSVYA